MSRHKWRKWTCPRWKVFTHWFWANDRKRRARIRRETFCHFFLNEAKWNESGESRGTRRNVKTEKGRVGEDIKESKDQRLTSNPRIHVFLSWGGFLSHGNESSNILIFLWMLFIGCLLWDIHFLRCRNILGRQAPCNWRERDKVLTTIKGGLS